MDIRQALRRERQDFSPRRADVDPEVNVHTQLLSRGNVNLRKYALRRAFFVQGLATP